MHWVVSDVLMLETVTHIDVQPSALGEECVSTGPPERPDHYHAIVDLGKCFVSLNVVCLVSVVSEHPWLQVPLDPLVNSDGLESLLIGISFFQLLLEHLRVYIYTIWDFWVKMSHTPHSQDVLGIVVPVVQGGHLVSGGDEHGSFLRDVLFYFFIVVFSQLVDAFGDEGGGVGYPGDLRSQEVLLLAEEEGVGDDGSLQVTSE
jgi:hypothetical protein